MHHSCFYIFLDLALVLRQVPDVSRYGKAILDENGILTGFNEKTADPVPGTINGGIFLMKKSLLYLKEFPHRHRKPGSRIHFRL